MPLYKLNINNTTQLEQYLNASFEKMAVILPDIEHTVLNVGANVLKEKVKEAFVAKMPSAARPVRQQTINGYKVTSQEPLVDAVRQSREKNNTVKVHILGANKPGSSNFIARFYEDGTNPRIQTKIKGKKLKKSRNLKTLPGYRFFRPTIESEISNAAKIMQQVYTNKLNNILNG